MAKKEKRQKKDSVLATLADEKYLDHAKQLFSSAFRKGNWRGDFALIAYNIAHEKLSWFRDKGIYIIHCAQFENPRAGHYADSIYLAKWKMFEPEFRDWKNVAYLDADIIVRGSIAQLATAKGFFALPDMSGADVYYQFLKPTSIQEHWSSVQHEEYLKLIALPIDLRTRSFNAGVLVFSTESVPKDASESLHKLIEEYRNVNRFGDQSIMNIYFHGKWSPLPQTFNFFYPAAVSQQIPPPMVNVAVVHFGGFAVKPWNPVSLFHGEWKENLEAAESTDFGGGD
ncbi:MAG: glycosyltransferase [Candidatus Pacebacteria bacterium]|nr:glycosyltransferase [Candidatus Paceibacterota bacterium]